MKTLKKIIAGICLTFGIGLSMLVVAEVVNPETPSEDKEGAWAALILFSLPQIVLGSGIFWHLHRQHYQKEKQLLLEQEQLFLALLQQQQGTITEIEWATAAKLSLAEAKIYLDRKASELHAHFETTEKGTLVYQFPVRSLNGGQTDN